MKKKLFLLVFALLLIFPVVYVNADVRGPYQPYHVVDISKCTKEKKNLADTKGTDTVNLPTDVAYSVENSKVKVSYYGDLNDTTYVYVSFESMKSGYKFGSWLHFDGYGQSIVDVDYRKTHVLDSGVGRHEGTFIIPYNAFPTNMDNDLFILNQVYIENHGECAVYTNSVVRDTNSAGGYLSLPLEKNPYNIDPNYILSDVLFQSEPIKAGKPTYLQLNFYNNGKIVEYAMITLKDPNTGLTIYNYVNHIDRYNVPDSYVTKWEGANDIPGTYYFSSVVLFFKDGTTKTIDVFHHDKINDDLFNVQPWNGVKIEETATNPVAENDYLTKKYNIKTNNGVVGVGEKTYITIDNNTDLKSVMLTFYNEDNDQMFSTYVKDLLNKPYFMVPSMTEEGTYKLKSIVLKTDNGSVILQDSSEDPEVINILNQTIKVVKGVGEAVSLSELYFDNSNFDTTSLDAIKNSKDDAIVMIAANQNPIITQEVFDTIKGTKRTLIVDFNEDEWVFNGKDIKNAKMIDVSMSYQSVSSSNLSDKIANSLSANSVVIEFPDNGELPGKALLRLKSSELNKYLKSDKYYVYYVDETNNNLAKVAMELQKSDDKYVEFYINHNSKYVITDEPANKEVVSDDESLLELNKGINNGENNIVLYVILGISFAVILVLLIIIVFTRGKDKNTVKEETKEEPKDDKKDTE